MQPANHRLAPQRWYRSVHLSTTTTAMTAAAAAASLSRQALVRPNQSRRSVHVVVPLRRAMNSTPLQWSVVFDVRWWLHCLRSWLEPADRQNRWVAPTPHYILLLGLSPGGSRYDNLVSLTCRYAWCLWTRRIHTANWSEVEHRVLASARVARLHDPEQEAPQHLAQLRSQVSPGLLRIASWVLYRLLSRIFSSIQFSKRQIELVRDKAGQAPVLYLPVFRSRLDCILVSFVLYMNELSPPLVAIDQAARVPFFGQLLRGLGAFYVDRRAALAGGVYQAVLQSYLAESLRAGHSIQLFVEPSATVTGKVQMPQTELLRLLLEALSDGHADVPDVCVVPVSLSYEKCLQQQQEQSFGDCLQAIWRTLHSNHGTVRVDFGQPFLLNEYLSPAGYGAPGCVACPPHQRPVPQARSAAEPSLESMARHVLHDASRHCALMSTHLVCFLLLNRYRKGTTLDQLATDLDWLRQTLARDKQHNLSVSGDSHRLIGQAIELLGATLIGTEKVRLKWSSWARNSAAPRKSWRGAAAPRDSTVEIVYVRPAAKLPSLLELHYYASTCAALFQLESVLATALFSLLDTADLCTLECRRSSLVSSVSISKQQLMERCQQICALMQHEFLFAKSCQPLSEALEQTFDGLVKRDVFVLDPNQPAAITLPLTSHHRHRKSFLKLEAGSLQNESILEVDEEAAARFDQQQPAVAATGVEPDKFYLRVTEPNGQLLALYRAVLRPYLQAYWLVARHLAQAAAADAILHLSQLPEQLTSVAIQLANQGSILYECTSEPTFRNALAYFETLGVLQRLPTGELRCRWHRSELEELTARIGRFADVSPVPEATTTTTTAAAAAITQC